MDFKNRKELLDVLTDSLGENILGACLYGSFIQSELRPQSDIDVLVVAKRSCDERSRRSLVSGLLPISTYPTTTSGDRPFEVTVVVHDEISPWRHPARKDFVFGEWLRPSFENGELPKAALDADLTLVLAQARQFNLWLLGKNMDELIPSIPGADIRKAIQDSLSSLIGFTKGDERNVLLTLARMLATLETDRFFSKDQAVNEIVEGIPQAHREVLYLARDAYLGLRTDDWSELAIEVDHVVRYFENQIRAKA